MLSRKKHSVEGRNLSPVWIDKLETILNQVYKKDLGPKSLKLDVYAQHFPEELLLITSLTSMHEHVTTALSCFVSVDLDPSTQTPGAETISDSSDLHNFERYLNNLLDASGIFWDQHFANIASAANGPVEFNTDWEEFNYNGLSLHYKISRENIGLSLAADRLITDHIS
ncbi:MAG: hypothetical protein HQK53_09195 [Oligoflexia bacterium]|nr:hypothetical protein [Oligoflexia bacterium]